VPSGTGAEDGLDVAMSAIVLPSLLFALGAQNRSAPVRNRPHGMPAALVARTVAELEF